MAKLRHIKVGKQSGIDRTMVARSIVGPAPRPSPSRTDAPSIPGGLIDQRGLTPAVILTLQRTVGNLAVGQLLRQVRPAPYTDLRSMPSSGHIPLSSSPGLAIQRFPEPPGKGIVEKTVWRDYLKAVEADLDNYLANKDPQIFEVDIKADRGYEVVMGKLLQLDRTLGPAVGYSIKNNKDTEWVALGTQATDIKKKIGEAKKIKQVNWLRQAAVVVGVPVVADTPLSTDAEGYVKDLAPTLAAFGLGAESIKLVELNIRKTYGKSVTDGFLKLMVFTLETVAAGLKMALIDAGSVG
ncbi:MAG: hypothetical protein ACRDIE_05250, partial [Chloroflexota bacterium]